MSENEIATIAINCIFKVHKNLGPGLLENAYEACLLHELRKTNLQIQTQAKLPLVYEDVHLEVGYRLDFILNNKLIIELKSVDALHDVHFAQILTYLKLSNCKLGLLVNYNVALIKNGINRIVNKL